MHIKSYLYDTLFDIVVLIDFCSNFLQTKTTISYSNLFGGNRAFLQFALVRETGSAFHLR